MKEAGISHIGRILEITPEMISVRIVSESACSSCHAKGFCGLGESKVKVVQLPAVPGDWYEGQTVNVNMKRSMGYKAVWISYVVPLVVLLAVLLVLFELGVPELLSGVAAIAAVAVYYLTVFLFRDKLRNEYNFYITK